MQDIKVRNLSSSKVVPNFHSIRFEDLYLNENMDEGLHRHNFFFLMILEEAGGKHHVDFTNLPVTSNTLTLIRPGQVHELILEKGSKGYLITFDSGYYGGKLLRSVARQNFYSFNPLAFSRVLDRAQHIFEEFTNKGKDFDRVIKANLEILFVLMSRVIAKPTLLSKNEEVNDQELLDRLMYSMEHQICDKKKVNDYAENLQLTTYKLNSITKKLLGKTCSQLITEQIILESKRILLATSFQVNEVAFKLGFEDPAYFIRFFKKHTSYTPKAFRQHFKEVPFF